MANKLDLSKTTCMLIKKEEVAPSVTDVEAEIQEWIRINKFQPMPEYGENYYLHKSWRGGKFGFLYHIDDSGNIMFYVHYRGPKYPVPLDTSDPSISARNKFSELFHYLFLRIKLENHSPRQIRDYFCMP